MFEVCDDGNIMDGDGCFCDCVVEVGFFCFDIVVLFLVVLKLFVIYWDFISFLVVGVV